jgi:hypothetical protein
MRETTLAASTSKTSEIIYQTTRRNIPENSYLQHGPVSPFCCCRHILQLPLFAEVEFNVFDIRLKSIARITVGDMSPILLFFCASCPCDIYYTVQIR